MKLLNEFNEELSPELLKISGQTDIYSQKEKMAHQSFCVFQLVPRTPRIVEIGYGLLQTPKAREANDCKAERERRSPSMISMAVMGMLPTPTSMMSGDVDMKKLDQRREKCKLSKKNGNGFGPTLN